MFKMKSTLTAKELYQLVIGREPSKARGDNGKILNIDQLLRLDKAHALIITRVHSSISSRVRKNGGDECPKKLWTNILEFGSSKKQSNVFKACHVCNPIIASGTTTDSKVTFESVLKMLDSQVQANSSVPESSRLAPAPSSVEENSASAFLTQKCLQGRHVSSATHTAKNCFLLHPEKLTKYQRHLKSKQEAEAHLAMFDPPSTYNVKATQSSSPTIDQLVASFHKLPARYSASISDGHESEVSML
ncbi:uncharacterized protein VP01_429g4 [Puccinia sorghi]|uniref:Uncharacterized protein n=1 Tax=Puccinia sorghi TaxID=27349 RepID=A0A0L6US44_9BASI|nr:uncharacterized protein VP01_429g4 [Puccinia sorghi]